MAVLRNNSAKPARTRKSAGFTIIELLVVVAIISVLLGLLLPALNGVKKRGRKSTELNNIKHVGHAWMMYANNNNDAALPGFLAPGVQQPATPTQRSWGVTYEYPDRTKIPIDANNYAGPWTWRLLSYLDYNHEMIHAHLDEVDPDSLSMKAEAQSVAYEPAFGYNGFYIGGNWGLVPDSDGIVHCKALYSFSDCSKPTPDHPSTAPLSIPRTISQIRRSAELVTFCASTNIMGTPQPAYSAVKMRPDTPGSYFVTPPIVQTDPQWEPLEQDQAGAFKVLATNGTVHVPLGRHTGTIAVLWADGHTDSQGYDALYDQRKWIDAADHRFYQHQPCP
jgi:prepilin-type N-terminal cleavage/methylation domain-containing protein/prepilin-type processing-associated H-X9-DG protein